MTCSSVWRQQTMACCQTNNEYLWWYRRQIGIPKIELKVLKMSWIYADQCAAGGIPTFMCHVHVRVCDDGIDTTQNGKGH